jgi:CRP/FNR family putative post-exponential-phase nitrogen-starvation transcriptional regulator
MLRKTTRRYLPEREKKMKRTLYPVAKKFHQLDLPFSTETLQQSYIYEFSHNEIIQEEAGMITHLYVILEGKAKIIKSQANGKRSILQFLHPKDFIGDLTLVSAEKTTKEVLAIGPTVCLAIPIDHAKQVLMEDIGFVKMISRYIGDKLIRRMEHFTINQTYQLNYRLALLLLEVAVAGIYQEKLTETAEYLGVSYRHLTYTLKTFKETDCVSRESGGYRINETKLKQWIQSIQN